MKHVIATIGYNPDAAEGSEIEIQFTPLGCGMLSELTDFELKNFAEEASLVVQKSFEMPPSPPSPILPLS